MTERMKNHPKRKLFADSEENETTMTRGNGKISPRKPKSPQQPTRISLGRQVKSNPKQNERFDLMRLNTKQYNDLLDGVDPSADDENKESRDQKKKDCAQKRAAEEKLCSRVVVTGNIYSNDSGTEENGTEQTVTEGNAGDSGTVNNRIPAQNEDRSEQPSPTSFISTNSVANSVSSSPSGLQSEEKGEPDNTLDSTLLLSSCAETQTEEYKCEKCASLYANLEAVLLKHIQAYGKQTQHCSGSAKEFGTPKSSVTNNSSLFGSSPEKDKEKMSTLVKGCTISIPLSKKAALDTEVPDGDPQRMTDYLLDCLLPLEEQAQMTCDGKTEGTKALPDKMRTCLQVYVKAKYNAKKFNFTVPLFKTWVNGKFYKARNWVRKYRPDLVEKGLVRPKMEKNMKKKSENEGDNKEEGSSSNKGEKSGNSSTKHVSQDSPKKPKPLKGSKSKTNTTQVSSDNGKRKHIKIDRKGYGRHKESDHTMSSRKRNIKESEKRHDSGKKKKSYKKRNDEDDISEKESNDRKRSIKKRNVEDDTSERESNDRKSSVKKRNNRDDDVNRRELDGRSRNSKRRNDGNENDYSMTKKSRNNDYESEGEERESDRKGTNTKRSDNGEEDDHRINKKRSDKDNERDFKEGRETCKKRNETAFEKNSNEERKRPGSDNHPDKGGKCPKSSILSETERKINELKFKTSTPKEKTKSGRKNPDDVDGSKFNEYISSTESSPIQSQHEDLSESDSDSNSLLATRSPVSESGASQSENDSD